MFIKAKELYEVCEKANGERVSTDVNKLSGVIKDKLSFILKNPLCEEAKLRSFAVDVYDYHSSAVVFIFDELLKAGYTVNIKQDNTLKNRYRALTISWPDESRYQVKTRFMWL
jgi:hypothetical protein